MPYFADVFEDAAPRDYKSLFSPMMSALFATGLGRKLKSFELDETPEFKSLLTYLTINEILRKHFLGGDRDLQNPDNLRFFKVSVSLFVQYLIDRYIHISDTTVYSEEQLLNVYGPLEIGIVEKNLPIEICVPILFVKFEGERIDISSRAHLASMMPEFQIARAGLYRHSERVNESVADSATHALFLRDYSLPNEGWAYHGGTAKASAYPLQHIDTFFAALRIVTGIDSGYAQVLCSPLGWARSYCAHIPYLEGASIRKYPRAFEDVDRKIPLPLVTGAQSARVGEVFSKLKTSYKEEGGNKLLLATTRLNSCFLREDEEDTVLDATIAMELLLSDGENTEITHKLAVRMAALSVLDPTCTDDPVTVFRNVKSIYSFRSALVHGNAKKAEKAREIKIEEHKQIPTVKVATDYIRMAIRVLLEHSHYRVAATIDEALLKKGPLRRME